MTNSVVEFNHLNPGIIWIPDSMIQWYKRQSDTTLYLLMLPGWFFALR